MTLKTRFCDHDEKKIDNLKTKENHQPSRYQQKAASPLRSRRIIRKNPGSKSRISLVKITAQKQNSSFEA